MICVSILPRDSREALKEMRRAFAVADTVELRIDGMKAPDLPVLIGAKKGRLIVANRRAEEGGFFEGGERERVEQLKQAVSLGADCVDVEAGTSKRLIRGLFRAVAAKGGSTEVLVSRHDLRGTPPPRLLSEWLDAGRALGADIVKIVTYANAVEDNLRILQLISEARGKGQRITAFCMGPHGRISRIAAPVFGSELTYTCLRRDAGTAPGQLTVFEMRRALRCIGDEGRES